MSLGVLVPTPVTTPVPTPVPTPSEPPVQPLLLVIPEGGRAIRVRLPRVRPQVLIVSGDRRGLGRRPSVRIRLPPGASSTPTPLTAPASLVHPIPLSHRPWVRVRDMVSPPMLSLVGVGLAVACLKGAVRIGHLPGGLPMPPGSASSFGTGNTDPGPVLCGILVLHVPCLSDSLPLGCQSTSTFGLDAVCPSSVLFRFGVAMLFLLPLWLVLVVLSMVLRLLIVWGVFLVGLLRLLVWVLWLVLLLVPPLQLGLPPLPLCA